MLERRAVSLGLLGTVLAATYGVAVTIVATGMMRRAPELMGAGVAFDLTVTAALATWLLAARPRHLPRRAPLVVLAVGLLVAKLLLPDGGRVGVRILGAAWGVVEIGAVALVISRLGRVRRRYRELRGRGASLATALVQALETVVGATMTRLIVTDLVAIRYALGGWTAAPVESERAFSMHRRSHWPIIAAVFVFLIVVETAGVHVVIMHFSPTAAWIASALSLYGAAWLIGDAHALRLNPIRLVDDGIVVEVGIRWRTVVPYADIVAVTQAATRDAGTLDATLARAADVRIEVARELTAEGLLGRRRRYRALLLTVDRPADFVAAVRARLGA